MSVIITGMDLPISCFDCQLAWLKNCVESHRREYGIGG